jgi:GAF domain-containing protein
VGNRAYTSGVAPSGALTKLRTTLLQPVLRIAAIGGLPLVVLSLFAISSIGATWLMVAVAVAYVALLIGALVEVRYVWRAWSLPLAMLILGLVEFVLYGKAGGAPLYFLGSAVFAGFFIGARSSYGVLAGCIVSLFIFLILRVSGRFTPLFDNIHPFSLVSWVGGWVAFGLMGAGLIGLVNTLLSRLISALSQQDVTSAILREDRSALKGRTADLQEANEALRRRTEYVDQGLAIAESLSTTLDPSSLLDQAVTLIADRFDLDEVRIFVVDTTGEWASIRAAASEPGKHLVREGYRVRRGDESAVAWMLDNEAARIFRLEEEAAISPDEALSAAQSIFVIPLHVGDQMLGVLEMQSAELGRFSGAERTALESLARQLALTLANAHHGGDETRVLEIASPFYRAAQQLAKARTDKDVYAVMLNALQDFDADRVLLVRMDPLGDHLVVAADLQGDQLTFTSQDVERLGMQSVMDVVILGLAFETALWVEDIEEAERVFSPELTEALFGLSDEMGAAAMAFVPLQVEGEILGGMLALHDRPHTFTPLEQRLFELIGELGGAALERSALVREAEVRLQQEQTLSQVGRRLRASLDPDTVIRITLEEVGRILDVELAEIECVEDVELASRPSGFAEEGVERKPHDLVIPLGGETSPVAWLNIRVRDDQAFEISKMELVEAIAIEAGRALESARLFAETQTTLQEAGVLYQGSRALVETGRTDELLRVFVDSLVAPELDRCLLVIAERSGTEISAMRVEAVWDAESDQIRHRPGDRWSVRDLPVLGDFRDEVVVVSDLDREAELDPRSRRTLTESQGVRAFLASPIISGQRLLGWFVVQSLDIPYDFTEREIRLYRGLSDQAATVLRNFELLEMATRRAEQERLLADISARMRETLDMDLILQTALREIGERLDVAHIEVQMQSGESL